MKRLWIMLFILGLFTAIGLENKTLAASSAIQIINIPVATITALTISGNPAPLIINSATAGFQPADVVNYTTTYNISTNETNKKITGMLNYSMPANTFLKIRLAAPAGATSAGDIALTTTATDLVTGISKVAESGKTITYTFSSTVAAGIIKSGLRTVILTITN
jgi:hypothetical protein